MFAASSLSSIATKAAASTFLRSAPAAFQSIPLSASSSSLLLNHNVRFMSSSSSSSKPPRPFEILGIQQIAIGSSNKSGLDALWKGIFGFDQPSATIRLEAENVVEDILKVGKAPYEVEVDLMVPIDETKSPKVRGSSLLQYLFFVTMTAW